MAKMRGGRLATLLAGWLAAEIGSAAHAAWRAALGAQSPE
jgi:hypothetical protein